MYSEFNDFKSSYCCVTIKDKLGNILFTKDCHGNWWEYKYDDNGNVIHMENSYGQNEMYYHYHHAIFAIDLNDHSWFFELFDESGNRLLFCDHEGYWQKQCYNDNDNLIHMENVYGEWDQWQYDHHNQLVNHINSYGQGMTIEYDDNVINKIFYNNKGNNHANNSTN